MQVEYEVLEAILTIEEAIKAASYIGEDAVISRGDPAAVFATGKNVVSGEVLTYVCVCVYMCVLILLYMRLVLNVVRRVGNGQECRERRGAYRRAYLCVCVCPHTTTCVSRTECRERRGAYRRAHVCVCVCVCRHTTICVLY